MLACAEVLLNFPKYIEISESIEDSRACRQRWGRTRKRSRLAESLHTGTEVAGGSQSQCVVISCVPSNRDHDMAGDKGTVNPNPTEPDTTKAPLSPPENVDAGKKRILNIKFSSGCGNGTAEKDASKELLRSSACFQVPECSNIVVEPAEPSNSVLGYNNADAAEKKSSVLDLNVSLFETDEPPLPQQNSQIQPQAQEQPQPSRTF